MSGVCSPSLDDLNRADHLLASIVVISEQTCKLVLEGAMEAARADARGSLPLSSTSSAGSRSAPVSPPARSPGSSVSSTPPRRTTPSRAGRRGVAGLQISMLAMSLRRPGARRHRRSGRDRQLRRVAAPRRPPARSPAPLLAGEQLAQRLDDVRRRLLGHEVPAGHGPVLQVRRPRPPAARRRRSRARRPSPAAAR